MKRGREREERRLLVGEGGIMLCKIKEICVEGILGNTENAEVFEGEDKEEERWTRERSFHQLQCLNR